MKIKKNFFKIVVILVFLVVYSTCFWAGEERFFVVSDGIILKISMHKIDHEQFKECGKATLTETDFLVGQKKEIAFLNFSFNKRDHEGEIDSLRVEEFYRRRVWGTLLMMSICNIMEDFGIRLIHLKVRATNVVAINFYFGLGFSFLDKENDKRFKEGFCGFVKMVKCIASE